VLGQGGGGGVSRGGAEDGEDEGDAAADGLGAVELGGGGEPELLGARAILPADDGGAVEKHLDGVAGGEDGGDAGVVVGGGYLGLRGEAGSGGQGGGTVGAVHFDWGCVWVWVGAFWRG